MSRSANALVLGYHGCDESVGRDIIAGRTDFLPSERSYDWLGPGAYFWENDPDRAREWAREQQTRGRITTPFVVGAVIDLGNCLDLTLRENLDLLAKAYDMFVAAQSAAGLALPVNKDITSGRRGDKLMRHLDCAVIRHLHARLDEAAAAADPDAPPPFDTVRGLFTEGDPVYPGGGFYRLTHTQIAVRTMSCIKGVFLPR